MGWFSSLLPAIAGFALGGPLGAAMGMSGTAASVVGGALAGGLAGSATGGSFGRSAISGALGGYGGGSGITGAASEAGTIGSMGAGGIGGASGIASTLAGAGDPIAAVDMAMTATGTSSATAAAQALGYGSTEAMLQAANPAWLTAGASFLTPGSQSLYDMGLPGAASSLSQLGYGIKNLGSTLLSKPTSAMQLVSGLYGMQQSADMRRRATDPFAGYREGYARDLNDLMSNPSSIQRAPGYRAGLQAVERRGLAQGLQGSGAMAAALSKYGNDAYTSRVKELTDLSGAGISPAVYNQAAAMGAQGSMSSLGLLTGGLRGFTQ